jgi:hypothetical protein
LRIDWRRDFPENRIPKLGNFQQGTGLGLHNVTQPIILFVT